MSDNRRSATRHDVDLEATVALINPPGGKASSPVTSPESCRLTNLSLGGAFFVLRRMPMGVRCQVSFRLPVIEEPVTSDAVVRWSTDQGIGVQFESLRPRDVWALSKYLESLSAS